jgi:hypothetical protein
MYKIIILLVIVLTFFSLSHIVTATMSSDNFQIWADAIGVSGDESASSDNYGVRDTVGEPITQSATSTSESYGVKAGFREMYQDQSLTFSLGTDSLDLGEFKTDGTAASSHTMVITTNADNGFTITVTGETLSNGTDIIDAIGSTATNSLIGTKQFGINLVANTVPIIGADPSGTSPIGTTNSPYNTTNQFAYNSGDTVASSSGPINETTYTVSYIVNVDSTLSKGAYSTVLTYTATGKW